MILVLLNDNNPDVMFLHCIARLNILETTVQVYRQKNMHRNWLYFLNMTYTLSQVGE